MSVRSGALVALLVVATQAAAQAPAPVVERIATHLGRTTRVTLFSNHVVIVATRSETEDYVHQATLGYSEYMVYLQEIERLSKAIGDEAVTSSVESRDSTTDLIVHVGPDAPRMIRYSPLASLGLAAGKIASIMDDLQNRALSALPGEHEVLEWVPEVGDRVELRRGGEAAVAAVGEDGELLLTLIDSSVTITIGPDDRVETILRILEPQP